MSRMLRVLSGCAENKKLEHLALVLPTNLQANFLDAHFIFVIVNLIVMLSCCSYCTLQHGGNAFEFDQSNAQSWPLQWSTYADWQRNVHGAIILVFLIYESDASRTPRL